nr:hypothetical protein [Octadecabacter antarcticus]
MILHERMNAMSPPFHTATSTKFPQLATCPILATIRYLGDELETYR